MYQHPELLGFSVFTYQYRVVPKLVKHRW